MSARNQVQRRQLDQVVGALALVSLQLVAMLALVDQVRSAGSLQLDLVQRLQLDLVQRRRSSTWS
jgi:hypothetical protein